MCVCNTHWSYIFVCAFSCSGPVHPDLRDLHEGRGIEGRFLTGFISYIHVCFCGNNVMTITNLNRLGTLSGPSGREHFQILFLFISSGRLVYINLVPGADVTIKQSVGSANRAAAERIT